MTLLLDGTPRVDDSGIPTRAEPDLVDLVARSARGDEGAFARLYDATSAATFGILQRTLASHEQAAVATQQVYLELWRHAAQYDPGKGTVSAWIATAAHRYAVDDVLALDGDPTVVATSD